MAPRFPEDAILAGFSWSEERHARQNNAGGETITESTKDTTKLGISVSSVPP
jgi:hypothetical protein